MTTSLYTWVSFTGSFWGVLHKDLHTEWPFPPAFWEGRHKELLLPAALCWQDGLPAWWFLRSAHGSFRESPAWLPNYSDASLILTAGKHIAVKLERFSTKIAKTPRGGKTWPFLKSGLTWRIEVRGWRGVSWDRLKAEAGNGSPRMNVWGRQKFSSEMNEDGGAEINWSKMSIGWRGQL